MSCAFHYVLALAWLWRRGQVTEGIGTYNHPNFSRICGDPYGEDSGQE